MSISHDHEKNVVSFSSGTSLYHHVKFIFKYIFKIQKKKKKLKLNFFSVFFKYLNYKNILILKNRIREFQGTEPP